MMKRASWGRHISDNMVPAGSNSLLNYPQTHQLRGKKKPGKEERHRQDYSDMEGCGTSDRGKSRHSQEKRGMLSYIFIFSPRVSIFLSNCRLGTS